MPNGGPDNCFNCAHNGANHGKPLESLSELESCMERSWCRLREVNITRPHWTYCANFSHEAFDEPVRGPVLASGLANEGYVRIPWHGDSEPRDDVPVTCHVCERQVDAGLEVADGDSMLGFCSNRHYLEWWLTRHDDEGRFDPASLADPDQLYPED